MSPEVTYVRSEDLLEESAPRRIARSLGLSRRRQLTGLAIAVISLPLLTLLLTGLEDQLSLDGQVLVFLLAVVIVAVIGGVIVGVASAVAAALLINYFFVDPIHTLTVAEADQAVALFVFVGVAALVSVAVEIAVRRARAAERARAEAETISSLAGPELEGEESLRDVLKHAREAFNMESVVLMARERGTGQWDDVEHVGWAPPGQEAPLQFDLPIGQHLRLAGRGQAFFAEDQRVLDAFAAAAQTAYEGQRLSGEAREARTLATVDEQRTALLAAVGHDLRTPLAAIKAAVTSLRQTDVDWSEEDRRELLATINDSADRLDAVVGNLLDASRLQAGALAVRIEDVAIDEVVSAAMLALPAGAGSVEVDVAEDLPPVRADRGLLQRVLVNVVDNAIRHGGAGRPVTVSARAGADSARLEITDHGPGVEDLHDGLFEPFQRLDDRGTGGVGLGLSVARGFIEAMGGAMVADHTPGGGLTMRIRLELARARETQVR
jgi:two-component system sensor histidine kinase KdpD